MLFRGRPALLALHLAVSDFLVVLQESSYTDHCLIFQLFMHMYLLLLLPHLLLECFHEGMKLVLFTMGPGKENKYIRQHFI